MSSKDFPRRGKGREGGRGGGGSSTRGRSNDEYMPTGRGGGMMGGPPRQSFAPRSSNVGGGPQEPAPPPPKIETKPPPEFNMKTNDFPALPGSLDTPARRGEEDRAFLAVVKGTGKLRLEDDDVMSGGEEGEGDVEHHAPAAPVVVNNVDESSHKQSNFRSTERSSSVSESAAAVEEPAAASVDIPLVNGDVKPAVESKSKPVAATGDAKPKTPVVSINATDREGAISPRATSDGQKLTYAQMIRAREAAAQAEKGKAAEEGKKGSLSDDKEATPAKETLVIEATKDHAKSDKMESVLPPAKPDHSKTDHVKHDGGHSKYENHSGGGYGKYDSGYKHRNVGKSFSSGGKEGGRGGRQGGGGRKIERTDSAAKSPQGTK